MQRADVDSAAIVNRYFPLNGRQLKFMMPFNKEVAIWDEFFPHLYRLGISVGDDYYETTFGMHETMISDHQPVLNGHDILRQDARRRMWIRGLKPSEPARIEGLT